MSKKQFCSSANFPAWFDATGVFQLTDVAWPRQAGQRCLRFRMQLFGFNAELAGGYLQEMAGQAWNIFPAPAQRR